ncbi:hypothetical protein COU74_03375 [Candidatus Peregrinibacteria bacterium CG10_big_fil_rev_8_21_14_0_10_36_19]|nr:MAG: hypothetical protein COU74_03375 [Candidatus Peregrinibacteria bacterium CG10_big_fil_rev_8_21_14_0_10_36_19]
MLKTQIILFLAHFINVLSQIIYWLMIARIISSWLTMGTNPRSGNAIVRILFELTDPVLNIAKKIPHQIGMLDLSAIIVLFAVDILSKLLIKILISFL